MPSAPSRFPSGVSTATPQDMMGMFGMPDPTKWHAYFDDFDTYVAGDWTITNASAGTIALTDIDGGAILVTNGASDDNFVGMNKKGEGFLMESGKRAFFKCRFKVSDATQSDVVIGLQITDATPLDVTDGIYFLKADDAATYTLVCRKDATTGSNTSAAIASLADNTFVTLGWYYDGAGSIKYYVNDVHNGTLDASSTYLPDTELTVSFALQNGSAGAKNMTVDFLFAAKER